MVSAQQQEIEKMCACIKWKPTPGLTWMCLFRQSLSAEDGSVQGVDGLGGHFKDPMRVAASQGVLLLNKTHGLEQARGIIIVTWRFEDYTRTGFLWPAVLPVENKVRHHVEEENACHVFVVSVERTDDPHAL